jgi:glutamate 5-kinase
MPADRHLRTGTVTTGTVVVNGIAGRALRKQPADVRLADVLDCSGRFATGDVVYVALRAKEGSQYAVATGLVRCSDAELRRMMATRSTPSDRPPRGGDADIVIRGQDVTVLWPARA